MYSYQYTAGNEHSSSFIIFLSWLLTLLPKLIAEDIDSPPNGQIHFSIISGDRNNEFSVDPSLGLIKVKKRLDRERVRLLILCFFRKNCLLPPTRSLSDLLLHISVTSTDSMHFLVPHTRVDPLNPWALHECLFNQLYSFSRSTLIQINSWIYPTIVRKKKCWCFKFLPSTLHYMSVPI